MNAVPKYYLFDEEPHLPGVPPPQLLVDWEPRWHSFLTAVGPALQSSEPALQGECRTGAMHGRNSVYSVLLHMTAMLVLVSIPAHMVRSQQLLHDAELRQFQVIYYSGNELPQLALDAGGSQAGQEGRAGGRELYHPSQVIHIARGNKLVDVVADAPHLKLPRSSDMVANLLTAPASDPGPPPAASLHSTAASALRAPDPVPAPPSVNREKLPLLPNYPATFVNAPSDAPLQIAGLRLHVLGAAHVIPPPVSAVARTGTTLSAMTLPASAAVAPPPVAARAISSVGVPGFGANQDVIPPPPQTSGTERGTGGMVSSAMKTLGSLFGSGSGLAGGGGTVAVVFSANPGSSVGVPGNGGPGALAMSPHGGSKPGLGGSGDGTGNGRGNGTGSGSTGSGPGAASSGSGFGAGAVRPGTSTSPGPGGTGSGTGLGGIAGVTIVGGKVTLPGFSTPANAGGDISRGPKPSRSRPAITIIASARAGGALNTYGSFKGAKVYTIYIETQRGLAVMQYAERSASTHAFEDDLAPPEPLAFDIPAEWKRSRLLISCLLDRTGALKNMRVVEAAQPDTAKIMAALENWRFRPVLRGEEPVEVDVMLGFAMDTR